MSSKSNIPSLFETALRAYEKQAGTNLLDNCLLTQLQSCNTVDEISTVLQEHAQAFHKFRGSDGRAISWLKADYPCIAYPVHKQCSRCRSRIGVLQTICFELPFTELSRTGLTRIQPFPCKCHLRGNWYPSCCMYRSLGLISEVLTMTMAFRRSRTLVLATMPLLTYSNRPKTS